MVAQIARRQLACWVQQGPRTREAVYVDNTAIEYADVADAAGIAREVEASLRRES